jgi:hypothetical protein
MSEQQNDINLNNIVKHAKKDNKKENNKKNKKDNKKENNTVISDKPKKENNTVISDEPKKENNTVISDEPKKEKIKNAGGRPKKTDKFSTDRQTILKTLLECLNINDNNNIFYPEDIAHNKETTDKILGLCEGCRKYFSSASWSIFSKEPPAIIWLSVVRYVLKEMKYKIDVVSIQNETFTTIRKKGYKITKQ